MPRQPSPIPTEVELAILRVLWSQGPSTVRQIHDALKPHRDTGYSTTLKMIQVMTSKKILLRNEAVRPQIYRPAHSQEKTQLTLLDHLLHAGFGGSALRLLQRAVSAKRLSRAELTHIKQLLEKGDSK